MENEKTRRKFSADFKANVVIEALKERDTIETIARKYELHPNQITSWKKEFMENAGAAFHNGSDRLDEKKELEAENREDLRSNRSAESRAWTGLKKMAAASIKEKRKMVEKEKNISMNQQYKLLSIHRNGLYYQPRPESEENLLLMRMLDEQ